VNITRPSVGGMYPDHSSNGAMAVRVSVAVASVLASAQLYAQSQPDVLQEIIVTATRREMSVQDIPYNISAVSGAVLENANVADIATLARFVPGVAFVDTGPRGNAVNDQLIIRGMNASDVGAAGEVAYANAPTVSTYLNDTPAFFNVKLTDIDRVEVLRGPQGTLYGSGSVGGTVRFIFNDPDPTRFSGSVLTKLGQTSGSSGDNASVDGVLNLPLTDRLALRVSAGAEHDAGVIKDTALVVTDSTGTPILAEPSNILGSPWVTTTRRDTDDAHTYYVRSSLLWKPADSAKVLLMYIHQEDRADGFNYETFSALPGAQPLTMTRPVLEPLDRLVNLTSLDATVDLGFATVTSDSSYFDNDSHSVVDFSAGLQNIENLFELYGGFPRIYSPIFTTNTENSFVEELRFVSTLSGQWDWIAGLFYQTSSTTYRQLETFPGYGQFSITPDNPLAEQLLSRPGASWADYLETLGVTLPNILSDINYTLDRQAHFEDRAAFGELTYRFAPAWRIIFGARIFSQNFDQTLSQTLPDCGPSCSDNLVNPNGVTSASASQPFKHHIFKANIAYKPVPDALVYATWAQGYRRGGANALPLAGPYGVPASLIQYRPDTVDNYEVGVKGQVHDRFMYTFDVYRINWSGVQIPSFTQTGGFDFVFNGGNARSQGIELQIQAALTQRLTATVGYTNTDAYLTSGYSVQGTVAQAGNQLPGTPRNQASVAFDYTQPLATLGGSTVRYHVDAAYRSGITTAINATDLNFAELPGFTVLNATVGYEWSNWKLGVFGNNLTDTRGVTGVAINLPSVPYYPTEFVTRPRTMGVLFEYKFDRPR